MTRGWSSPACPKRVSSPFTVTYSAAQRPGCHGACWSARTMTSTPASAAIERAASTASAQVAGVPLPHRAGLLAAPARTTAARRG